MQTFNQRICSVAWHELDRRSVMEIWVCPDTQLFVIGGQQFNNVVRDRAGTRQNVAVIMLNCHSAPPDFEQLKR